MRAVPMRCQPEGRSSGVAFTVWAPAAFSTFSACPQACAIMRVEFSDTALPKNGTGKILKRVLRERFWDHQQRAVS